MKGIGHLILLCYFNLKIKIYILTLDTFYASGQIYVTDTVKKNHSKNDFKVFRWIIQMESTEIIYVAFNSYYKNSRSTKKKEIKTTNKTVKH